VIKEASFVVSHCGATVTRVPPRLTDTFVRHDDLRSVRL
jgi:hypothetical protein